MLIYLHKKKTESDFSSINFTKKNIDFKGHFLL